MLQEFESLRGLGVPEGIAWRSAIHFGGEVPDYGPGKHSIANRQADVARSLVEARLVSSAQMRSEPQPFRRSQVRSQIRSRVV